jgi:hypothetical protein
MEIVGNISVPVVVSSSGELSKCPAAWCNGHRVRTIRMEYTDCIGQGDLENDGAAYTAATQCGCIGHHKSALPGAGCLYKVIAMSSHAFARASQ